MPAIFVGHGNPMNIIRRNQWTEGWNALGAALPRPRAILTVSAHGYLPAMMVTAMPYPRTIHDFSGFPQELYEIKYPAPGDPALAARVRDVLAPIPVEFDEEWGLDHGAWSVLYLPLLYVPGSRGKGEGVSFPVEGFDGGSMSMLTIQISG